MNAAPRISVVLATRNGSRFLRQALASIFSQSFQDFELILIDDASTDVTPDIIKNIQDPRLRTWRHPRNLGLTTSLNEGLERSRGEYIARHDDDDISLPDRFAHQISFLDLHPEVGVVGCQALVIDQHGCIRGPAPWRSIGRQAVLLQLLHGIGPMHGSVLMRRSLVWEQLGGYDPSFRTNQDFELWTRVTASTGAISSLPETLLHFRTHERSISRHYNRAAIEAVRSRLRSQAIAMVGQDPTLIDWVDYWVSTMNPRHRIPAPDTLSAINGLFQMCWSLTGRSHCLEGLNLSEFYGAFSSILRQGLLQGPMSIAESIHLLDSPNLLRLARLTASSFMTRRFCKSLGAMKRMM